jgi:hypothetical protein
MPWTRKLAHSRRIAARRWFSKNHRDFQTLGRLTAWRSSRSRTGSRPAMLAQRTSAAHLPVLSSIVAMRREDAVLHVEFLARSVAFDGRPLVHARDAAGAAPAGANPDRTQHPGAEGRTWTVTLALN